MAEQLKYMYNEAFIKQLSGFCKDVLPGFDQRKFGRNFFTPEWDELELMQRVRHVAKSFAGQLSGKYKQDIKDATLLAKHVLKNKPGGGGFTYIFLADYIEQYGLDHPKESLKAMETMTILSSCEFAIRPFIEKYQEQVMSQMLAWTTHEHPSVRRLASEGCRPRLPWGMALKAFKKDPAPILPILEALKSDPSEYVRKSVANNLNDITRDNPELVMNIIRAWKGSSKETDWILKHGSRTLLKKADEGALSLFGVSAIASARVKQLKTTQDKIRIGDDLVFSFVLRHKEPKDTVLRVEYMIYYMKANGVPGKKIFKVTENTFAPNRDYPIKRKQSFKNMTTRKHYEGRHELAIVVNGKKLAKVGFEVFRGKE